MGYITIGQINDAIADKFRGLPVLESVQSYDELTEGMNVLPALQVYPDSGEVDAMTDTDRTTFRAGVRNYGYVFHADLFAKARSDLAEDIRLTVALIDEVERVLGEQQTKPYFGLPGIQAFSWRWERATLPYANVDYAGARFFITIRVF